MKNIILYLLITATAFPFFAFAESEEGGQLPAASQSIVEGEFLTRAEALKLILDETGMEISINEEDKGCFPDVEEGWQELYVCFAFKHGYVDGYKAEFAPFDKILEKELLKIMHRLLATFPQFVENSNEDWHTRFYNSYKGSPERHLKIEDVNLLIRNFSFKKKIADYPILKNRQIWLDDECIYDNLDLNSLVMYSNDSKGIEMKDNKVVITSQVYGCPKRISTVHIQTFELFDQYPFAKDNRNIYWNLDVPISSADLNTFTPINYSYSKDTRNGFYKNIIIPHVDVESFKPIVNEVGTSTGYMKDSLNVFFEGKRLYGVNPESSIGLSLNPSLLLDEESIFFNGKKLNGINPNKMRVVSKESTFELKNGSIQFCFRNFGTYTDQIECLP